MKSDNTGYRYSQNEDVMTELSKNAILYIPEGSAPPRGIVQIIHGMGEYQGRYRELAQYLSHYGFAVITSDLRGHGNNLSRMNEIGFFGDNAVRGIIGDIHENTRYIREQFPKIPYVLLGHGLGALIATAYFKRYDNFINGLFLSGIPSDRPSRMIGNLLIRLYIALRGEYFRSKIVDALMIGPYYKPFTREGSISAWLTQDAENLHNYDSDPKCGFIYPLNGYRTITELADAAYTNGSWIRKNLKCPIRILYGSDDPCITGNASFQKTLHLYTENGYTDVAYISYPGQRHDIFHDTARETVFQDILHELERICCGIEPEETEPESNGPVHIVLEDFIDPEVEQPFKDPEQKINLEAFINAHNAAHPSESEDPASKVEMIDYVDIESFINPNSKVFTVPSFSEYEVPSSKETPPAEENPEKEQ